MAMILALAGCSARAAGSSATDQAAPPAAGSIASGDAPTGNPPSPGTGPRDTGVPRKTSDPVKKSRPTTERTKRSSAPTRSTPVIIRGDIRVSYGDLACVYEASRDGQHDVIAVTVHVIGDQISGPVSVPLHGASANRDDAGTARVAFTRGNSDTAVTVRVPVTAPAAAYSAKITLRLTPAGLADDPAGNNTGDLRAAVPFPVPVAPVRSTCSFL
jgi:hypothetical protein